MMAPTGLPSVEDFANEVESRGPGMFLKNARPNAPVIIVHAASTHDLISSMWTWAREARRTSTRVLGWARLT